MTIETREEMALRARLGSWAKKLTTAETPELTIDRAVFHTVENTPATIPGSALIALMIRPGRLAKKDTIVPIPNPIR